MLNSLSQLEFSPLKLVPDGAKVSDYYRYSLLVNHHPPLSLFPGRRFALSVLMDGHSESSLMAKNRRQARNKRTKESRCTSFVG